MAGPGCGQDRLVRVRCVGPGRAGGGIDPDVVARAGQEHSHPLGRRGPKGLGHKRARVHGGEREQRAQQGVELDAQPLCWVEPGVVGKGSHRAERIAGNRNGEEGAEAPEERAKRVLKADLADVFDEPGKDGRENGCHTGWRPLFPLLQDGEDVGDKGGRENPVLVCEEREEESTLCVLGCAGLGKRVGKLEEEECVRHSQVEDGGDEGHLFGLPTVGQLGLDLGRPPVDGNQVVQVGQSAPRVAPRSLHRGRRSHEVAEQNPVHNVVVVVVREVGDGGGREEELCDDLGSPFRVWQHSSFRGRSGRGPGRGGGGVG